MKGKPIKIDWDELESAFNNRNEELVYFLDLVTGQVILEGEGESDAYSDDDDMMEEVTPIASTNSDNTMLQIEPPGEAELLSWMGDFVKSLETEVPESAAEFKAALDDEDAVALLKELLNTHDEARDRWFLYRSERMHDAIDAWIDANDVKVSEPPPWK